MNIKTGLQLLKIACASGMLLFFSTHTLAAPNIVSMNDGDTRTLIYNTVYGYSQVEYAWPRSGVVCRNETPRTPGYSQYCRGLIPNVRYTIIDFATGSRTTFRFPDYDEGYRCVRSGKGNFRNIIYGQKPDKQFYIFWSQRRYDSWVQLQEESPKGPRKLFEGETGAGHFNYKVLPGRTYRLTDLTYGGDELITLVETKDCD